MPRYQYSCPDCGYSFEAQQKFTDKPLKKCPQCSKRSIYKVISNVSVAFKGTGFYINDSKKSDDKKSKVASGDANPSAESAMSAESASPDAGASGEDKEAAKTETTATETKPAESTSADKPESKTETKAASSDAKKSDSKGEKKEKKAKS